MSRLKKMFNHLSSYGQQETGINRIAYSKEEQDALAYLIAIAEENGFLTRKDAVGNLIITRLGTDPSLAVIATGSHIDSVYEAGKYDGLVGVISGLEIFLRLNDKQIKTKRSLELIVFACEESARFGVATIGSKVMTGHFKPNILKLKDKDGVTLKDALIQWGYEPEKLNSAVRKKNEVDYFIELHTEQGPVLERENKEIGLVTGIAAPTRFQVCLKGEASHSGATPMSYRKDALVGASEIILELEKLAYQEVKYKTVATCGVLEIKSGAMNVVPGEVIFQIDIRSINYPSKKRVVDQFTSLVNHVSTKRHLQAEIKLLSDEKPVLLDKPLIKKLEKICLKHKVEFTHLPSGAGHDAMNMSRICKTGMLFIPSKEGISHNPKEYTSFEAIERGVSLLEEIICDLAK